MTILPYRSRKHPPHAKIDDASTSLGSNDSSASGGKTDATESISMSYSDDEDDASLCYSAASSTATLTHTSSSQPLLCPRHLRRQNRTMLVTKPVGISSAKELLIRAKSYIQVQRSRRENRSRKKIMMRPPSRMISAFLRLVWVHPRFKSHAF